MKFPKFLKKDRNEYEDNYADYGDGYYDDEDAVNDDYDMNDNGVDEVYDEEPQDELNEGSHDLADGMVEFDEEGISKIANSYKGDIKPLANKLQAALDAGKDYQTFTSIADGVNGSVKFIYKLDSVKTGDDK